MGKFSCMHNTQATDFAKPVYECSQHSLPKFFFLVNAREGVLAISLISCKGTGLARFIGNFQVAIAMPITYLYLKAVVMGEEN